MKKPLNRFFVRLLLSISSVSTEQSQICANEFDPDYTESEICKSLVISTESVNANTTSQSSTPSAQGNWLQDCFKKFAERQDQTLLNLCNDAGFLKKIEKGQFFITTEEGSEIPVLDVKLYLHEGRYCIDIMIESLFKDRTVSWVRIVNGVNKYVTETSEEIRTENVELFISKGKIVAKAKPTSFVNSSVNVPVRERKWIDIDEQPFDRSCFEVSKFMTRTLQHESSIPREGDGAVRVDD